MLKNSKIIIGVIAIIAIVLIVINVQRGEKESGSIKVGVAVAQTSYAAEWGEGEYRVYKMYIDSLNANGGINGQSIQLIAEDTKTSGDGTVAAVRKLIDIDKVQVILGPTWVDSYQGPLPIAENAKVVLLTPSAAIESISDKNEFSYLFTTFWPQSPEIEILTNFMLTQGIKTFAIINDHDPFDTQISDNLQKNAELKGITMIDREQVPVSQNDFRTEILKIKQKNPDALFVQITNVAGLGPFMKQTKELGLNTRVFSSPDAQNQDALSKFGTAMEGLTYPFLVAPTGKLYEDFTKEYQIKYNSLPSTPSAIPAYNAVTALVSVLKDGARTGTEIRDALRKINIPGLGVSTISFNEAGQIKDANFEMKMIHNNEFITIK